MVKARGGGGITAELEDKSERGRTRTREENNINNNMDSSRKSRSLPNICKEKPTIKHAWKASDEVEEKFEKETGSEEPSLIALYLQQRERGDRNSWNGTSRPDICDSSEASFSEEVFNNKVSWNRQDFTITLTLIVRITILQNVQLLEKIKKIIC